MARSDVQEETIQNDWLPLLDEELSRLPEDYRLPIVLCDLEGKTRREAADRLGWPEGTVAGRLARGRALLARRLVRYGSAVSSSSLAAVLAQNAASACVSETLLQSTARVASLLGAGTGAVTAVIPARVAALTEGVVRAMFLAKLKTMGCALALTVVIGLGGVSLVPGSSHLPAAGPQEGADANPDTQAQKLVRQLGSPKFAERQAAQKALANMGARAAVAVRDGMRNPELEVSRRCAALWARLWQTEIARPDAERLAGYSHPLWARFRKVAGDDPDSRTLFAEMVADLGRFSRLEAVEADPEKAVAAYAAELKQRAEALERGYREAEGEAAARPLIGFSPIVPKSGYPTRSESVITLFLGTYPATAKNEAHVALYTATPPALRRLFAAWLGTRTASQPIANGLINALSHNVPEVLPVARAHAVDDKLAPRARGFAVLAVACYGSSADLPAVEKAFADSRVYAGGQAQMRPVEVQVSDAAVAAALWLAGQEPADFGFTLLETYKVRGPEARALASVNIYGIIGFFQGDDTARQAAHKKAIEWLNKHRKEKPLLPARGNEEPKFEEVVVVKSTDGGPDLLYVILTDPKDNNQNRDAMVLKYAKAALQEAARHKFKGATKKKELPRYDGNIVFLVRATRKDRLGIASGFSVAQLQQILAAEPERARQLVQRHAWSRGELPAKK